MPEDTQNSTSGKDTVALRLDVPKDLHDRISQHKLELGAQLGRRQNIQQATIDLLHTATKKIKPVKAA